MTWMNTAIVGSAVISGAFSNKASKRQRGALDAQTEIAMQQLEMAREQWDYYKTNYQPLEQDIIADARKSGTPEAQEAAAGRAVAGVRQQFGISRDTAQRGLERYGLNPSDPTYQSMLLDSNLSEAATSAGSANAAREGERNLGYTKMIQALSLGKGLPTEASANMARASAGYGNVAAGYGGVYRQDLANTYNLTSSLAQMPWNKIFSSRPRTDVIGDRATSGQLGPPGDYSGSGIYDSGPTSGANAFGLDEMREGGVVRGKGTSTSDSNVIRASKGEFVIPAAVVRAKGMDFFYDLIENVENKSQRRMGRGSHGS